MDMERQGLGRFLILSRTAAGLPPGSFSFVMATGIVSIAASQQQMDMGERAESFMNLIQGNSIYFDQGGIEK